MKKIILLLMFVFAGLNVHAQESAEWHTDFNKAMEISNKNT